MTSHELYSFAFGLVQVHAEALPEGPKNPYGNGFIAVESPLRKESEAARVADGSKGVYWKVNNPDSRHPASGLFARLCVSASWGCCDEVVACW